MQEERNPKMKNVMKNVIFFDDNEVRKNLLPLTFTRPISKLRIGISTIEEKWKALLGEGYFSHQTASYMKRKYPLTIKEQNLMVAGNVIPTEEIAVQVNGLRTGEALVADDELIAFYGVPEDFDEWKFDQVTICNETPIFIHRPYDIFLQNGKVLQEDFRRITAGRTSMKIPGNCTVIGDARQVYLEEGACVEGATLNTKEGPIYIGKNAEIMEGACVRGPFAACHDAKVKIGAKVYGATTLGPYCKIGGEVENSVMMGYSNKAHEGFLGDAVIGEWCNLGGGTTASNLKNDYKEIKMWNYASTRFEKTGLQFCGLIMGDHCKTGVNCMINTATVLGVGVNIHGAGFPRNFVASFLDGSNTAGFKTMSLPAFLDMARRVMARRGISLTPEDEDMYTAIYKLSKRYQ